MSVSMQRYQNIELSSQVFTASNEVGYPLDPLATKWTDHYQSLSLGTMLKYALVPGGHRNRYNWELSP